jgi:hypothetical protein
MTFIITFSAGLFICIRQILCHSCYYSNFVIAHSLWIGKCYFIPSHGRCMRHRYYFHSHGTIINVFLISITPIMVTCACVCVTALFNGIHAIRK